MPTGVEEVIAGGIGLVGWLSSLPDWVKYAVFLAGLSADTGIEHFTGYGVVGGTLGLIVSNVFNIPGFSVTSFQVLVLALVIPLLVWVLQFYQADP